MSETMEYDSLAYLVSWWTLVLFLAEGIPPHFICLGLFEQNGLDNQGYQFKICLLHK